MVLLIKIIKKEYDQCITRDKNLDIKALAIILMLVHYLFTFSNRLPKERYISFFRNLTVEQFLGDMIKIG